MNNQNYKALTVYLQDHLAGSVQAIELIDSIRVDHLQEELGEFARELKELVEADQETLGVIADSVGSGSSSVKESVAWIGEKLTLLKLHRKSNHGLGTIEALEFLELGIHGKWALWRALGEIPDLRVEGIDFRELEQRAAKQRERVEEQRLRLVRKIFADSFVSEAA